MAHRPQLEAPVWVDGEAKTGPRKEGAQSLPGTMAIALAVVGEEQVTERLTEAA